MKAKPCRCSPLNLGPRVEINRHQIDFKKFYQSDYMDIHINLRISNFIAEKIGRISSYKQLENI